MAYFLRIGNEDLEDVEGFPSEERAVAEFTKIARGLLPYGQKVEGSIYIADLLDAFPYPDFVLSLDPLDEVCVEPA